ncbi:MAG: NAD-dependent epimerase/dehydratase family protein, partial [Cyanobacteria bacterium P01_A01_bin.70]
MSAEKPKILVTGGAGYIGSHAVLALEAAGYPVVILDSLEYGHPELVAKHLQAELIKGETSDRALLDHLFQTHNIGAVMHFAAYIAVGESVQAPAAYYRNNVTGTLTLLEAMLAADVKQFVFSSTCAIYGPPKTVPIPEDHPPVPINLASSDSKTSSWAPIASPVSDIPVSPRASRPSVGRCDDAPVPFCGKVCSEKTLLPPKLPSPPPDTRL